VIGQETTTVKPVLHIHQLYLLTSWSRVLRKKQTGFQLLKTFPAFYGTFTSARHLFLFISHSGHYVLLDPDGKWLLLVAHYMLL